MTRASAMRKIAGRLATTCWCEAKVFYLPKERVGVETVSCGRDGCTPPATGAKRANEAKRGVG